LTSSSSTSTYNEDVSMSRWSSSSGYHRPVQRRDEVDEILDQWAAERPDLDPSPMGVIGRIARLGRSFDRSVADVLATHGLGADEFDVLATLRRQGSPYRLNPTRLRESMMVTSATMTHRLDKLEQRGLITREPDPADRRGVLIALTPTGRSLVDRAVVDHVDNEHRLLAALAPREREQLAGLLRRLSVGQPDR
jgi:DNA-binding MarR family transcriptional regulator